MPNMINIPSNAEACAPVRLAIGGFYRLFGKDMLFLFGGGMLLILYDEMKAHGPASVARQVLSFMPQTAAGGCNPEA